MIESNKGPDFMTRSWYCFTLDVSQTRGSATRMREILTVADPLFGPVVCGGASPNEGAES
jgi:hypothetical protein